jgi:fructokinase
LPVVVVFGEALVDLVPGADGPQARPGGSPANVAITVARLGFPAHLLARLATDQSGQMLRTHLTESGVDLSLCVDSAEPTAVAAVELDPHGAARYRFELDGRTDDGWTLADLPAALPDGVALHVSGAFALARPAMRAAATALLAREAGRRVLCLDPNPRPALPPDLSVLEAWLAYVDIVKVSAEDLAWTHPGETVSTVARRWYERGPRLVVVTRGGDGVFALGPAGSVELPAYPVAVVDTVGAGDAFTGGLLAALPTGPDELDVESLTQVLGYAQRVAALTCTRAGADPPWAAELFD